MTAPSPVEILAAELFADTFGGTSDPEITALAEGIALSGAQKAVAALEAAGYRVVPPEPTAGMLDALTKGESLWRTFFGDTLRTAIAAAPTWGEKP